MELKNEADDVKRRLISPVTKVTLVLVAAAALAVITWQGVGTWSKVNSVDLELSYHRRDDKPLPRGNSLQVNVVSRHRRDNVPKDESCFGNETVTQQGGKINSPGYPKLYPSSVNCNWYLTSQDDSNITLNIVSLQIEDARNCDYDYLKIYGGPSTLSPLLGKFCGKLKDYIIHTNSSRILITFHSDPSYEEQGFLLHYSLDYFSDCKTTLTDTSGVVTSPNYPENYPDNSDCWTLISVPFGHSILIEFDVLSLEVDFNCTYDYVEFFDGDSKDGDYLGRFCSPGQERPVQSLSSTVLVHFFSDQLLNSRGFYARYSSVISPTLISSLGGVGDCVWEKGNNNGTIASPNYPENYPSNAKCVFVLQGPVNSTITLKFQSLQLESGDNCSYDGIIIKDGLSPNSPVIGIVCDEKDESKELTTTSNVMVVTFTSDNFIEFSGFKASYFINKEYEEMKPESDKIPGFSSSPSGCQFEKTPKSATVPPGSAHVIKCVPKDPNVKIRWLKDEQFLGGDNQLPGLLVTKTTLWIKEMNSALVGTYTCTAVREEGTTSVEAVIRMGENTTNSNCNIVLSKVPQDKTLTEGEFTYLYCLATGDTINLSWEYNGSPMIPKSHMKILSTGILVFENTSPEDSGIYTCVVKDGNCEKKASAVVSVIKRINIEEVCGKPQVDQPSRDKPSLELGKIVGGHDSRKGAYPWQVMLWEPNRQAFCGAALVNERWIVTAAHCFSYKNIEWDSVVIKLGKYNQNIREREEIITTINDVILHPDFDNNTFDNDIALIKMKHHIEVTEFILPICLGTREFVESTFFSRQLRMGTVTGWGKLKEKGGRPKILQELRMPIVQRETCIFSTPFKVTRNMFCAGYAQEIIGDACYGDSGGPFVMEERGIWYLVGVVSWGEGCGREGKYGFYTRVNNYHPWIKGIIKS